MSLKMAKLLKTTSNILSVQAKRNIGVCAPAMQKVTDPIQRLFLEKVREYKQKSSGGQMVDVTPETQRELNQELMKLAKQYGGGQGVDMTKFPEFKFSDPKLDSIDLEELEKK
ncbi:hypothetical protein O3M35_001419 [Rhynocoris fuscipes]|uniref:ATP synthase-coupling factor 6, mitochondrial n=1 Tax=Rhynocoris fuscipes TaxID=488301 RepID=A0AAW1CME0_9HEMI